MKAPNELNSKHFFILLGDCYDLISENRLSN